MGKRRGRTSWAGRTTSSLVTVTTEGITASATAAQRAVRTAANSGRSASARFSAAEAGGTAPAVLNAANEVAVGAFLEGRCRFPDIVALIERVLAADPDLPEVSFKIDTGALAARRVLARQTAGR